MMIQQRLGLRPSELLAVLARDVVLPEETHMPGADAVTVGLGLRVGTKAKRPQSVLSKDPVVLQLLRWLKSLSAPDDRLVPFTYENYRRLLRKVCSILQLPFFFTPHSPRSGFACDLTSAGVSFLQIKELGRWVSDQSLRTYIDLVQASSIGVSFRMKELHGPMIHCLSHWTQFFPGSEAFTPPPSHGAEVEEVRGHLFPSGRGRCSDRGVEGLEVVDCEIVDTDDKAPQATCRPTGRGRGRGPSDGRGSRRVGRGRGRTASR